MFSTDLQLVESDCSHQKNLPWPCRNWKTLVASVQTFMLWQQATVEVTPQDSFIIACSHHIHVGVILHTHGELHIQCNANWEVATTSPFRKKLHHSHVLSMKVAPGTILVSWSQHHFVVIRKPELQVHKSSHFGSKQQQMSPDEIPLLLLVRATYIRVLFFTHILFIITRQGRSQDFSKGGGLKLWKQKPWKGKIACD